MSHVHDGPLATYNSLSDDHLSGYFANSRMRRHLRKSGLISRGGQIVSESTYRLNMSRKEHKKHVKDMLAQAIVHKTLDLERSRQSDIKKKLEEIAKIQLVRRVRATTGRRGDEDILPLLTPRASRPGSSPAYQEGKGRSRGSKHRPYSAPRARAESRLSQMSVEEEGDVLYLDDEGRPLTPVHNDHNFGEHNQIDTRHLHTMDTAALRKYAMLMATMEEGRGVTSPYMLSQVPLPPKTPMSSRTPRSARRVQSASPQRPVTTDSRIARLHRPETAKVHYGDQQTMCKVLMKYHGWALKLAREKMDPTQEVVIEQQHCGGNTLTVFKDRLLPGSAFEFISYRHRGYPFSLSLYVDGQMDSRVSTCCEYRHKRGAKIGGKQGHFSVLKVEGAVPCYKCQVAKGVVMRNKATSKKPKRAVKPHKEEVIVVSTARDDYDNEYLERRVEEPKPSSDASYDDDFEASSKTSDSSSSSSDSESETESSTRKDEGGDSNQAARKEKFSPFEARGEDSEAASPSPRASDQRAVQSPSPRFKSPRVEVKSPRVEVNGTGRDIDDYSSDGGQENKDKVVSMEDVEAETKPIGRRGSSSSSSSSSPSSSSASGTPRAHDSQRQRDDNAVVSMAILDKEEDKKKERERQDEARRREREEQLQQQREERDKRQEEARQREEQRRQELQYREQERQEESRKREEQRKLAEEKERQRRQEEEENRRKAALMEEDPELKDQERMKAQRLREAQILEEQIQREATRKEEERAREQRFREEEARRVEQREREEADRDRRRQELEESMSRTGSSAARSTSSAATGSSASTSASSSPQTTPRRAPQTQDETQTTPHRAPQTQDETQTTPRRAPQTQDETQTPRDASPQRVDPYLLGAKPQEDQLPPRPVSPFPDAAVYVARPKRHDPVPEPAVYQPRSRPTQETTSPEQAPREEEKEQQDTFRSSASETNPSSSQYSASDSEEDEEQEELARPKTAAGGRLRDGRRLSDEGW